MSHPRRSECGEPYRCRRRVPRQKFSINDCSSGGFKSGSADALGSSSVSLSLSRARANPSESPPLAESKNKKNPPCESPSQMRTSVSTLQWTRNESVERRTVPRMPIRQCSIVGVNSEVGCGPGRVSIQRDQDQYSCECGFGG